MDRQFRNVTAACGTAGNRQTGRVAGTGELVVSVKSSSQDGPDNARIFDLMPAAVFGYDEILLLYHIRIVLHGYCVLCVLQQRLGHSFSSSSLGSNNSSGVQMIVGSYPAARQMFSI